MSPIPVGELQLSLLAPDVKEQLWGWQDARLAAKQAWEDGEQSREIQANGRALIILETQGKQHFVPWPGNGLDGPCQIPQTLPKPCPSQSWQPGPLGRTLCTFHFVIPT